MPRCARFKIDNGIYHIMCRSISEVTLFKSGKDKVKYLELLKKQKDMHDFRVYAYCIMGNHVHLMIDGNGADISKVMHGVNLRYARYYNKKYNRHGHLFQDRFKSKIVTDEKYMKQLSLYIHDNPRDFKQFEKKPEKYRYSSLGIYLGKRKDSFDLVEPEAVLQLFGDTQKSAVENYYRIFLKGSEEKIELNFKNEKTEYRSGKKPLLRNVNSEKLIKHVFNKFNLKETDIHLKYDKDVNSAKALAVVALRKFAGKSDKEIADIIGDITQARISQLSYEGIDLIKWNDRASMILKELASGI